MQHYAQTGKTGLSRRGIPLLALVFTLAAVTGPAQELAPNKASELRPLIDNPAAAWGSDFTNWVEISAGGFFVNQNRAELERRYQLPARAFGGIESLHYEQAVGTNGVLTIDGRGIFDNEDYELSLDYTRDKLGYVKAGVREYKTWYDRSGGFYPLTGVWFTPWEREVSVDRGEAWFEAGLRIPDAPELTLRYSHDWRDGTKDSTEWGDMDVSLGLATGGRTRSIVPSFWNLDEKRDRFELDLAHTLGKTDFQIGGRYEHLTQNNTKFILRAPTSATAVRAVTQEDDARTDIFNAHGSTATRFNDNLLLTLGGAFNQIESDSSGSRIYGAGYEAVYDPTFSRRQQFDEGFFGLNSSSTLHEYLFNANLLWTPLPNLTVLPSVRFQDETESGDSESFSTNVGPAPTRTSTADSLFDTNDRDYLQVSEALEARYTGLTNWVFYARGEWSEDNGNITQNETDILAGTQSTIQDTDTERFTQKYIAGLNWYPLRRLNFGAQYYHKIRDVQYENRLDPNATAYPGFLTDQNFDMDDMNFRVTFRPTATLTLIGRYDFQLSTVDTLGDSLGKVQSAQITTHIVSGNVSWTPLARLYLQGSVNYVMDETHTGANDLNTGTAAYEIVPARNDYWNLSLLGTYSLDDKTDLQAQYYYYRANDYLNNSLFSQAYGAGAEEHGVTVTLARQFTKAIRWTLKYGFFTNRDVTYGGHKSYDAHLVYTSLQYRF